MNDEDWRVEADIDEPGGFGHLRESLESKELTAELDGAIDSHVVVSRNRDKVFLYAGSERTANAVAATVERIAAKRGWTVETTVAHWHDDAEDWEPAATAEPSTQAEHAAERRRLMEREDREAAEQGYPDWEVRIQFADHDEARELSKRLSAEGIPHVRRWKYLLITATDEDAAKALAERFKAEAGRDAEFHVEGTMTSVIHANPWRFFEELGGGP